MSLQVYLTYVVACIALALLPGPNVTLLIANGLRYGTRAALINIAGTQLGLAIVIGTVAVGLTTLMRRWAISSTGSASQGLPIWSGSASS